MYKWLKYKQKQSKKEKKKMQKGAMSLELERKQDRLFVEARALTQTQQPPPNIPKSDNNQNKLLKTSTLKNENYNEKENSVRSPLPQIQRKSPQTLLPMNASIIKPFFNMPIENWNAILIGFWHCFSDFKIFVLFYNKYFFSTELNSCLGINYLVCPPILFWKPNPRYSLPLFVFMQKSFFLNFTWMLEILQRTLGCMRIVFQTVWRSLWTIEKNFQDHANPCWEETVEIFSVQAKNVMWRSLPEWGKIFVSAHFQLICLNV